MFFGVACFIDNCLEEIVSVHKTEDVAEKSVEDYNDRIIG